MSDLKEIFVFNAVIHKEIFFRSLEEINSLLNLPETTEVASIFVAELPKSHLQKSTICEKYSVTENYKNRGAGSDDISLFGSWTVSNKAFKRNSSKNSFNNISAINKRSARRSTQWKPETINLENNLELLTGENWMEWKPKIPHKNYIYLGTPMYPLTFEESRIIFPKSDSKNKPAIKMTKNGENRWFKITQIK